MMRWVPFSIALMIALAQVVRATPIVVNSGFERTDGVTDCLYTYPFNNPGVSVEGWQFAPSESGCYDGLVHPGTVGMFTTLTGYEGSQVAFIEEMGQFSQTISGFNAGTFTLSFLCGGRYYAPGGNYMQSVGANGIMVRLDDTVLTFGSTHDPSVTPTDGVMSSYTTNAITIEAGTHTITFMGTDTADHTSLIDGVRIGGSSTIPEPASIILVAAGIAGLLCYAWRKRK